MSSAFDSSWDFLKALNPMGGGAAEMGMPEQDLRHYNNMQQQRSMHSRPAPGPKEGLRSMGQSMNTNPADDGRPAMPPGDEEEMGATEPRTEEELQRLLQQISPDDLGAKAPSMSRDESMEQRQHGRLPPSSSIGPFAKAWGLLKAGPAPFYSSTDQGYDEDPLLSEKGQRPVTPRMPSIDPNMEMSDEDYLNMLLSQREEGPKMHELAGQGKDLSLGDTAEMGDLGADMVDYHRTKPPRNPHSMDTAPPPPALPKKPLADEGQRTLDEF
jgi:hypothetical protein